MSVGRGQEGVGTKAGADIVLSGDTTVNSAIRIGVGGTLVWRAIDSTEFVTWPNMSDGEYQPIIVGEIRETGTTCTNISPVA